MHKHHEVDTSTAHVFRSVEQALHVSYLMEVLPVSQRSFMQALLESYMKACGIWEAPKAHERTINFGGLSPLEIRGQCAMVRGVVDHHLAVSEASAVRAYYGHTTTKADGVRNLCRYAAPMLTTTHAMAVLALGWGVFGTEKQREGLSLREVADYYGLAKSTAQRDQQTIRRVGREMLGRAVERLEGRFRASGLIENDEISVC